VFEGGTCNVGTGLVVDDSTFLYADEHSIVGIDILCAAVGMDAIDGGSGNSVWAI